LILLDFQKSSASWQTSIIFISYNEQTVGDNVSSSLSKVNGNLLRTEGSDEKEFAIINRIDKVKNGSFGWIC